MKLLFFNHRCRDHTTILRNSSLVPERGLFSVEYADCKQTFTEFQIHMKVFQELLCKLQKGNHSRLFSVPTPPPFFFKIGEKSIIKRLEYKPETHFYISSQGDSLELRHKLRAHFLVKKSTFSCFESQKTVNSNIIIVKSCEKCFVQTTHFSDRS